MLPLTAVAGKYTTCGVQSVCFLSFLPSLILPCVLHFPRKPFNKPQRARLDIPVQTCIHAGESAWRGTTVRARKLVFPLVFPEEQKKKKKPVGFFTQMPDILHSGLWGWAMGGESVRWSTSCTTDYSLVCLANKEAKTDSWKKSCWRTETWLWSLCWTVPLQHKAERETFSNIPGEYEFFTFSSELDEKMDTTLMSVHSMLWPVDD